MSSVNLRVKGPTAPNPTRGCGYGGWGGREGGQGGRGGVGAQLKTSAWPVITAQSQYMGRLDFPIIAPT